MSRAENRAPQAAPWVRTRLRTSRGAGLLLAVLVLVTSFLATGLPRVLDRDADAALTAMLTTATPGARSLSASTGPGTRPQLLTSDTAQRTALAIQQTLTSPLAPAPAQNAYGARNISPEYLTDPALPRPDGIDPALTLVSLADQQHHLTLVAGTWPDPAAPPGSERAVQVALAKSAADLLGVKPGSVLTGSPQLPLPDQPRRPGTKVTVSGVFEPTDRQEPFWSATPCVTGPCLAYNNAIPASPYWKISALVPEAAMGSLAGFAPAELFWQIPVDPHHLRAAKLDQAQQLLASILSGRIAAQLPGRTAIPDLRVNSMLPALFSEAQRRQAGVAPLHAIGPLGAGAVALVVLLLAAGLAVDRRRAELVLLRARGGSLGGIGGRLLAESAVLVLPAALLGIVLALVLLPTERWSYAVEFGLASAVLALLPFPLRAVLLLHEPRRGAARRRPSALRSRLAGVLGDPRRLVAEIAVLVVAAAAVLAVRRRGVAPPGSSVDLLLSAAPMLLAVAGAVLLARLFPLLLAPAVRVAAGRTGAIGFLGLARATRGATAGAGRGERSAPTVLPLMALLLAVTTAGFGVTVLNSTDTARQLAVRQAVGADARVLGNDSWPLPPGFTEAAAKLPGVQAATTMVVDSSASPSTADGTLLGGSLLLIVDPQGYAALARHVGYGQLDPALLDGWTGNGPGGPGDPVPAIVTEDIAGRLGAGVNGVQLPDAWGSLKFSVVGTVKGSPALPAGGAKPVVVVSRDAVLRQLPKAKGLLDAPNGWYGTGDKITGAQLRALLTKDQPAGGGTPGDDIAALGDGTAPGATSPDARYNIVTRYDFAKGLGDNPLEKSAARLFWAAVVGAAGYSLLSLLLTLLRAAPERAALLARLRTMGLRPREGLVLILIEVLPQALLAALAGAGVACLSAPLLGAAVDLSAMVGAQVPGGLRIAPWAVAEQAGILAALAALVVVAETALAGRRQINTELRAGDQR
ncbi:hypothetical protein C7C46_27075 [Streptomyces tateyamensis]|uniref:ABC transporter permease n=1 Tax=Streptomyces tateyamensis TaxID=565073 RepID=A0A2V4N726_9ACTN|nr:hypothetical protein [Streptomyces tateyamensis]PYC71003.1 hypothetical protein C7C46_27075 [Streptomyces tateyamensis]